MALISIRPIDSDSLLGLWKIEEKVEDFMTLFPYLAKYQNVLEQQYRSDSRKREFLAVRALLHEMLGEEWERHHLAHLPSGKPILDGFGISISHTKGYVTVMLSTAHNVALDIEYSSERVGRIASKFIREDEIARNIPQLLVHWSAKETIYKLFSEDDLRFDEMRVRIPDECTCDYCWVENMKRKLTVKVFCEVVPEYVMTYAIL